MKPIKEATLIVCSIVRNAEKGLRNNIPVIDELCKYFKDYRIIVYENNSIDKTKEILKKWHYKDTSRIHVCIEDTDSSNTIPKAKEVTTNPFFSFHRIAKMAKLRNKYMEYIDQQSWDADYMIVVDLDVAQLKLDSILSSFSSNKEWDAVTAYGYSMSPKLRRRYHDTYALTCWGDEENPQTEKKIKLYADKFGKLKNDDWIRVYSAFGGFAIYRFEAIKGLRYKVIQNHDERVEVKCEHFSIYNQMIERGYNRFYINPQMDLKYQALSLKIIYNSFLRMINRFV